MSKKDGGPAFPVHTEAAVCPGMSLRNWFAGMALVGNSSTWGISPEVRAKWCYAIADAMLAESDK